MLRSVILAAARSPRVARLVETAPISRDVVRRFVAGPTGGDALRATQELVGRGLAVTLDYLGEDTLTAEQAEHTKDEYLALLASLDDGGLTPAAEVSVKLSALGQRFDEKLAEAYAREICAAAAGRVHDRHARHGGPHDHRLDAGDAGSAAGRLPDHRRGAPGVPAPDRGGLPGAGPAGQRVRLCKGAYKEPETVAFQSRIDVDKSYVRCMNILMSGEGYPMLATHDPRLVDDRRGPGEVVRSRAGSVRVPDALRHPSG